jgi:TRAP-type C4-dicarboxylate transport system permease small subunit
MMADAGRPTALDRVNSALTLLETAAGIIAALAIFAIMAIVTVDVVLRYLFNAPLVWSYDLIGIFLVPLMFFFAVSLTFSSNHHIAVDIVYLRMSPATRRVARLAIAVLALAVFAPIAWLAAVGTLAKFQADEAISGTILWPTWIPSAFMFVGCLLLCLRFLGDAIALLIALATGASRVAGEAPDRDKTVDIAEDMP